MILNIETSSEICSVALEHEGEVIYHLESDEPMQHSALLASFVDETMKVLKRREEKLDAVAVSMGPGSYTGLRIGLSLAKGLCFSLDVPLIGVSTLQVLAVKAMFKNRVWEGDELLVPVVDARRDEVYTGAYDFSLNPVMKPGPLILDENSYRDISARKLIFIGNAVEKVERLVKCPNAEYIKAEPLALDMTALSEKALREKRFLDIAYSVPEYLKDFQATTPKKKI